MPRKKQQYEAVIESVVRHVCFTEADSPEEAQAKFERGDYEVGHESDCRDSEIVGDIKECV